jgi:general stress protein 26
MSEIKDLYKKEAIEKIKELANAADICMFTTSLNKLPLTSRPMSNVDVDDAGDIWFLSKKSSNKNGEIAQDNRVQLFYASKGKAEYLSVYGEASIVIDKNKAKEKWTPIAKAWFTEGVDDPEVSLIRVKPIDCYYWDTKNNRIVYMLKAVASMISGNTIDDGIEGKLNP